MKFFFRIETIDEPNDHRDLNQNTERDSTEKLIIPFKILSVSVLSYKHVKALKTGYFLFNLHSKTNQLEEKSCHFQQDTANEKIDWICSCKNIPWSRLLVKNDMGFERSLSETKWKDFNVEMENKLYSLWGSININQKAFQQHVGKHHMACSITALVMAHMYNINEWNPILLDSIVIHGGKFFLDTVQKLTQPNYQLKIDDFNGTCSINKFQFSVNVQHVLFGHLYDDDERNFNLNRALDYAFRYKNLPGVILQCAGRNLAIGNIENRDYFMFDCQSFGHPLFAPNEGTAYVLKCCCLKVLLACVVLTLNVKRHTIDFHLYAINTQMIGSVSVVNDDIASEHKNSCTNSNL